MKKAIDFVRPALVLLIVAAIAALVLGGVSLATSGRIESIAQEKMENAMQAVLPASSYADTGYEDDGEINAIYEAPGAGWVVQVTESGSQGLVTLMVGVDVNYYCTGISVTESSETAGLGAIASQQSEKGDAFRAQFVGQTGTVAVTKEGGAIDAISGATITSKAICRGVTAALNVCRTLSVSNAIAVAAPVTGSSDASADIYVTQTVPTEAQPAPLPNTEPAPPAVNLPSAEPGTASAG